jgi:hypothetical protein
MKTLTHLWNVSSHVLIFSFFLSFFLQHWGFELGARVYACMLLPNQHTILFSYTLTHYILISKMFIFLDQGMF